MSQPEQQKVQKHDGPLESWEAERRESSILAIVNGEKQVTRKQPLSEYYHCENVNLCTHFHAVSLHILNTSRGNICLYKIT
jgi:hypothetical protein